MPTDDLDAIIPELHRIREQIAAEAGDDVYVINAQARARMEKSQRKTFRQDEPSHTNPLAGSEPTSAPVRRLTLRHK